MKKTTFAGISIILLGFGSVVTGCADRTLEDYRRDKVSQELHKFQEVSGVYSGAMTSVRSGAWVGNVSLELKPETTIGESSDRLTQEPKAVLRAKASIQNGTAATSVVFNNAFYDDETRYLRATIQVPQTDGPTVSIDLYGTIEGNRLVGRVEASGYPEEGASVVLEREMQLSELQPVVAPGRGGKDPAKPTGTEKARFMSKAEYYDGSRRVTGLVVSSRAITTEEEWVTSLLPTRTVGVTLELESGHYFTQRAVLDLRTRTLRGRLSNVIDLDCVEASLEGGKRGWNCSASGLRGYLFMGLFSPEEKADLPSRPLLSGERN